MEPPESLPAGAGLPNQGGEKPAADRPAEPVLALQAPTAAAELVLILLPPDHEVIARDRWPARLLRHGLHAAWRGIGGGPRG